MDINMLLNLIREIPIISSSIWRIFKRRVTQAAKILKSSTNMEVDMISLML